MNADAPLAEFELQSGAQRGSRLTLFANRLVHQGQDSMETVPLAQLAAVRIAFGREQGKLGWAIALAAIALALAAVSGPMLAWSGSAAARIAEHARRESLDAVLLAAFTALGGLASILPVLAAALGVLAAVLAVFFWRGQTTLTLSFGAGERAFAVRGRNRFLIEFAEMLGARLAERGK